MSASPTVLIFTLSEHGQANVNLAIAYQLALSGVNVCVASSAPLKVRVSRLQDLVIHHVSLTSDNLPGFVSFHECKGFASWREAAIDLGLKTSTFVHPHGVSGALESYRKLPAALFPWGKEEYNAAVESCKEIIATIEPNVVAIDVMFHVAEDACTLLHQKYVMVTPNSIKELVAGQQPWLSVLWKYPALSSGFPFPLKWWQIPLNVYLNIRLIISMWKSLSSDNRLLRRSLGSKFVSGDKADQYQRKATYICPALPEIDFPFTVIPQEILLSGPIIMPFDPLEEVDPALAKWLDNGQTVMINLGSHIVSDRGVAREMACSIRTLVEYHDQNGTRGIQVLWKIMASEDIQGVIDEIIGKEIKDQKVKVVPWMDAEPVSILQHPNVICTVHHGGANSYFEGVWSGIPHIVLPVWYDTYEFARRAGFLNIGIFANKTCAPGVRMEEFVKALVRVTGDTEEAAKFRKSAKALKDVCRARGNGRELASMAILKEAA